MTRRRRLAVLRGNLDLLVLRALSTRPMHGFELADWIDAESDDTLQVLDSALYQSLYRLEAREFVVGDWGRSGEKRRAKYYDITHAGRVFLKTHTDDWVRYARAVSAILERGR